MSTLHLLPNETGFSCQHGTPTKLMISQVVYPSSCEACTRMAFAASLEQALKEGGFEPKPFVCVTSGTSECTCP